MPSNLISILALSFLGSVCGLAGGLFLLWKGKVSQNTSLFLIAFAAGVIISAAFLDLWPEAVEAGGDRVFGYSLIGLVAFFLVEDFLLHFHHHEGHDHPLKSAVPLVIFSDSVHNFIDGVIIAGSYVANPGLGLVVALATFVHEIPQEIGDFAVLMRAGVSKIKIIGANLLSAAATFVGAIATFYFSTAFSGLLGPLLGLATGMFLYISSVDILPEIVKEQTRYTRWRTAGFFLSGIIVMFILSEVIAH